MWLDCQDLLLSGKLILFNKLLLRQAFSALYAQYGPPIAWIIELVVIGLTFVAWLFLYRRMVPLAIVQTVQHKPSYVFTMDDYSDDSLTFEKEKETNERVYRL